jgi:hypothetical protein
LNDTSTRAEREGDGDDRIEPVDRGRCGHAGALSTAVISETNSCTAIAAALFGGERRRAIRMKKEAGSMPAKKARVKNEKQHEALKEKGMSKSRAAKIANSPGASKRGGKKSGSGGDSRQGGTTAQHKAAGRKGGKAAANKG